MKEFVLLFRMDVTNEEAQPTPKQMELYMQQWMGWINEIAAVIVTRQYQTIDNNKK